MSKYTITKKDRIGIDPKFSTVYLIQMYISLQKCMYVYIYIYLIDMCFNYYESQLGSWLVVVRGRKWK